MSWTEMLFSTYGRIRRRDWWLWMIGKTIALIAIGIVAIVVMQGMKLDQRHSDFYGVCVFSILAGIFGLSNICLTAKRWHDRNKSGWMYLVLFVPFVGWLWTLIECGLTDGTPGRNRYGKSPKGIADQPATY